MSKSRIVDDGLDHMEHDGVGMVVTGGNIETALPTVNLSPSVIGSSVGNDTNNDSCTIAKSVGSEPTTVIEDRIVSCDEGRSAAVNDKHEIRSPLVGENLNHREYILRKGRSLFRKGWLPTRWEHAEIGVIELPIDGDVQYRYTMPDGTIDEVTRDGQLRIKSMRGLVVRGEADSLQKAPKRFNESDGSGG